MPTNVEEFEALKVRVAESAAKQVSGMTDEELFIYSQSLVLMMEAADAEYKRRNAILRPSEGSA